MRPGPWVFMECQGVGIGHLFTTGPNLSQDRIFHVAGTRFATDAPPVSNDWLLNPDRRLTKPLVDKSNVTNPLREAAPSWQDVGDREVRPFFADLDVLFVFSPENQIDWFRERVLDGVKTPPVCVDLFEMAQYFLPRHVFYDPVALLDQTLGRRGWQRSAPRLPFLVQGLQAILHDLLSAILSDGLAYAFLQEAVATAQAPEDFRTLYEVARQAHRITWTTDLFARAFEEPVAYPLETLDAQGLTDEILARLPDDRAAAPYSPAPPSEQRPVKPEDVDHAFDTLAETAKKANQPAIQPRPSQRAYARFCAQAINEGGVYAIEAGAGTGKTLGYLMPVCELLRRNPGHQALLVTATKNLQNQIVEQEIPKLTTGKTLYRDIEATVLKGKANYLCITALTDLYEEVYVKGRPDAEDRLAWLYLYVRLVRGQGTLEGIPRVLKARFSSLPDFIEEVNAQTACVPGLCRVGPACVFPRRMRKAWSSDIVVTNQHKLASVGELLRLRTTLCFIDEADQFPASFRSSIQKELSDYQIRRRFLRRLLGSATRRGYAQILEERFRDEEGDARGPEAHTALATCRQSIEDVVAGCRQIESLLIELKAVPHLCYNGAYRWGALQPRDAGEKLQVCLTHLVHQFARIAFAWEKILSSGRYRLLERGGETGQRHALGREKIRVEKYRSLALDLKHDAEEIAADYPSDAYVHVYARQGRGWTLTKIPFDIREALDGMLFEPFQTVLFTSASLFVNDTLDLFAEELGLQRPFTDTLRIPSPFDYRANVFGAVTTFIRPFDHRAPRLAQEQWRKVVARTIAVLVVATYGRTLVLFTNVREMREVFDHARPILQTQDIDPILQDGSSLAEIQAFRLTEHSVLFGVDRFWTGVDFPGPTLSQVVVVRLPNPNLSDPLIQHRMEHQGEAFWDHYYHPVSRLKLKQGFGRLIRSEKDRGIFVVLDQRLAEFPRMQPLQDELPVVLRRFPHEWTPDHQGDLQDLVTQGLATLRLSQEFRERNIDLYSL